MTFDLKGIQLYCSQPIIETGKIFHLAAFAITAKPLFPPAGCTTMKQPEQHGIKKQGGIVMSKRFARLASAFAAVGLLCGCVLPAFAAETAQQAALQAIADMQ